MKFTTNIIDIDFDGAKIAMAERDGSNLSITIHNCALLVNHPGSTELQNKIDSLEIVFHFVTEEKAELFKGKEESTSNAHFPPLDVIETFEESNGKYKFGGYLSNEPWSVWEFKARNYVVSW